MSITDEWTGLGIGLKQLFLRGKGRSWVLTGVVNMRHGEQFH